MNHWLRPLLKAMFGFGIISQEVQTINPPGLVILTTILHVCEIERIIESSIWSQAKLIKNVLDASLIVVKCNGKAGNSDTVQWKKCCFTSRYKSPLSSFVLRGETSGRHNSESELRPLRMATWKVVSKRLIF